MMRKIVIVVCFGIAVTAAASFSLIPALCAAVICIWQLSEIDPPT